MFSRRFALSAVLGLALVAITGCGGGGLIVIEEPPASIEFSLQPSETVVNAPFNTTVVFKNSLGHIMPISGLPVKLFIETNAGGGTLLGTAEATSKFGVCYFFDSLNITEEANGYTLRAEWEDKTAISDPFDIIPVAVGSIAFDVGPSPTPADDPFTVTVILRDQNGLFLPRDDVPVTIDIATNPAGGTLSGVTTVLSVAGVCTFAGLSIDNFGAGYVLRATYLGFVALSGGFPILPPPVASLFWATQPVDTLDNETFGCVVELRDAGGTPVPVDGLQVTLSIKNNPGGGTLSGTVSELCTQGVCTFTGLNIDKAAAGYTLEATHLAFMQTSTAFEILASFTPPTWNTSLGSVISGGTNGGANGDDGGTEVSFGFNFPFFGTTQTSCFVNSNGNITFGSYDNDFSESVAELGNDQPRISPWWDDLLPVSNVYANTSNSDRLIITYNGVAEWTTSGAKYFQVTMWDTGRIDIVYGSMTGSTNDGLLGISPGGGASGTSYNFSSTAWSAGDWTDVSSGFPYEQWGSSGPDLANGWIVFEPLSPGDGSGGYRFTTG